MSNTKALVSALVVALTFALTPLASARAAVKHDCSVQQAAIDQLKKQPKPAADLTACQALTGKAKTDCQRPLKEKAKEDARTRREHATALRTALACCKKPEKTGCR
jgi:hypothetical protein